MRQLPKGQVDFTHRPGAAEMLSNRPQPLDSPSAQHLLPNRGNMPSLVQDVERFGIFSLLDREHSKAGTEFSISVSLPLLLGGIQ